MVDHLEPLREAQLRWVRLDSQYLEHGFASHTDDLQLDQFRDRA
jgi:hypothetical protein